MTRTQRLWIALVVAAFGIVVLLGWQVQLWVKQVNEPDPDKADTSRIEAFLSGRGIKAHIEKVRYIYLDDFTYILEGQITKVDPKVWQKKNGEWWAGSRGLVRQQGHLIGFSDVSTPDRIEPHFADHWRQLSTR